MCFSRCGARWVEWCLVVQDGKKLVSGSNMQIDRVSGRCSLHIQAVTGDDEAEYLCEAHNECGTASTVQQLLVNCRYFCLSLLTSGVFAADTFLRSVCLHVCMLCLCGIFSACDKALLWLQPASEHLWDSGKNGACRTNLYLLQYHDKTDEVKPLWTDGVEGSSIHWQAVRVVTWWKRRKSHWIRNAGAYLARLLRLGSPLQVKKILY